jgi:hypothetical protein
MSAKRFIIAVFIFSLAIQQQVYKENVKLTTFLTKQESTIEKIIWFEK